VNIYIFLRLYNKRSLNLLITEIFIEDSIEPTIE